MRAFNPFPYAVAAFGIAALLEYPLAKKYPLKQPLPMGNRMLAAGALAFVSTYAASWLVSAWQTRPQLR